MTLDERIEKDLTELYQGKEISSTKDLKSVLDISAKGLPQHFVGDRNAKTVFVMLNPGKDVKKADEDFEELTAGYDRTNATSFIKSYIDEKTNFGIKESEKNRKDSFDEKQAAFLKPFEDSGINIPAKFPDEKTDELCLQAKQNVLMQKCQLELLPYCSAKFSVNQKKANALIPFVETLLDEIFRVERKYVIFGGAIFADLFKKMQSENIKVEFLKEETIQPVKNPLKAQLVKITKDGKSINAVIARSFARQDIGRAYKVMAEYGKMCFDLLKH